MEFNDGLCNRLLHVLMFPWLAHGHISAFLQLSIRLAANGIKVSFLSTPHNISKLKKQTLHGKIQLVELELAPVEGLPPGIENTADLPSLHLMSVLKRALDGFEKPFEALLRRISPDVVIFDVLHHKAPVVAANLSIPSIPFSTFGIVCIGYILGHCKAQKLKEITVDDLTKSPPDFPSPHIAWKPFEARKMFPFYTEGGSVSDAHLTLGCFRDCSAIAVKSCSDIEDDKYRKYLETIAEKPVLTLGPLLPYAQADKSEASESPCLRWLENQSPSSVVYVSFGTECPLSEHQIEEIALGLEGSNLPFIWVLRFPHQKSSPVSASLPWGFEDRIRHRGLVWSEWAPQRTILSHPCTGGFLTHCGWNSLMEGMSAGLPLIALPMQYDQGLNARLVSEELKVGVEVGRDVEDGLFKGDEICKAVKMAMIEEEGRELRLKATKMGNAFKCKMDGLQKRCIQQFIKFLQGLKGGPAIS